MRTKKCPKCKKDPVLLNRFDGDRPFGYECLQCGLKLMIEYKVTGAWDTGYREIITNGWNKLVEETSNAKA